MNKILYIGDFTDFFATEHYISHGLEQLGYEVLRVQDRHARNSKAVLGAALKHEVDFVLFSKGNYLQTEDVMKLLRDNHFMTVGWIFDLYFDLPAAFGQRQLTGNSFRANICCSTDGGHTEKWKQCGVNHRLLRQGIHEPDAYFGQPEKDHPEIVFIGTYSYDWRIKLIDMLRHEYRENFRHYGRGGTAREVRGKKLNNVLASAKIVVGDSVPSKGYWSNRIYEIIGRGGFLLHPNIEGLETEFTEGVHYVGYDYGDYEGLKKKINYYLSHPAEREKIRKAGFDHVKKHYTYTKRCEKLIEYVKKYQDERK